MAITSICFLLLSVAAVFVYYLLPFRYRKYFLILLSLFIIGSYSLNLSVYIIAFSVINFYLGLGIPQVKNRIILYRIGILFNLLQLILLQYATFAVDPLIDLLNSGFRVSGLSQIILPVGISYFTLQAIGYLINVKMGWEKPEKTFPDFFLYIIFYPKFLSGPIERSNHFLPQIKEDSVFNSNEVTEGLRTVLFGLFKKVVIANQLAQLVNPTYTNLDDARGLSLCIVLLLQPLYLYFDFSGYTDIAIGLARTFGIKLLPNFNRPFFSENMTTFWKRFHISLSSWFNDYVFRQTSFRYRKWGVAASVYALLLTWILFGIWHGAGWNFMILGFIQASAIIYEFFTKKLRLRLFALFPELIRVWIGRTVTYLFYAGSLVFFFSPDLRSSFLFYSKLSEFNKGVIHLETRKEYLIIAIVFIALLLFFECLENDFKDTYLRIKKFCFQHGRLLNICRWTIYYLMLILVFYLGQGVAQFIYFQF